MKSQDQLKVIVEKMVEEWADGYDVLEVLSVGVNEKNGFMVGFHGLRDDESGCYYGKCFEQLITNPAAMKAAVGDGIVCDRCGSVNYKSTTLSFAKCSDCSSEYFVEAYIYLGLKTAEFLLKDQPEQAINYLYNEVMK